MYFPATAGADAVGGGLPQDGVGDAPFVPGLAEHGEADAGPTLFHGQGRAGDVQSALGQQLLSGKGQGLRRHVVDMAAQLHDLRLLGGAAFTPKGPDTVGGGEFLFAHAVAGLLQRHDRHGAEALSKVGQQGGAGGGTQLSPDVPGVAEDALQQVGGGGSGTGTMPWAQRTWPLPRWTGDAVMWSGRSIWTARQAPVTSATASRAPTSWKWIFSTGIPWALASASAMRA